ncbi:MAG: GNAT family N-acetyltransferase [Rhodobacteraceae bacterium]|jgi:GNAT superfamily N-acetyltransferase|nr:GNAT family N-acetyltransferase [Paracoccaceae bacterium]
MGTAPTLTVRPAGRADIAAVDALLALTYPVLLKADYPPSVMVTAVPLIARANPALVTSGHYFVVADGEGRVVGAGGCTPGGGPGGRGAGGAGPAGHIRHVVADHRRLRQGIGRRLMERLFAHAHGQGLRLLLCQSTRTAVPFYRAMGFVALGPVSVELRPGIVFPAEAMARPL